MKKTLLVVCLCAWTVAGFAQHLPQGLGIQIGFAEPVLRLNSSDPNMPKDSLVNKTVLNGFKVGLVYDGTIIKGFGASVGLNYTFAAGSTDWQQQKAGQIALYPQERSKIYYNQLELFVDWQYKFEIAKETYIILYTGPSIQCAVSMNTYKYTQQYNGAEIDVVKNSNIKDDYQRINATWGIGAGFQYQRYFLRGGYDFGLINPYKVSNFNDMGISLDRRTRGRLDQWNIRLGIYLWTR